MRIVAFSDLHLEFGSGWRLPPEVQGDLMILGGDIITLRDYAPLDQILQQWKKPVIFVMGNHEYYTRRPMDGDEENIRTWLTGRHPHVTLLLDEAVSVAGVNFFGGTMWTDFNGRDRRAMETARSEMSDFHLIRNSYGTPFTPADAVARHETFVAKLTDWFNENLSGPRVVVTHHAPVINPRSKFSNSDLIPAFNSLDMVKVIESRQPALWVYGHTHECDDQTIGNTRIISNQLGYPGECTGFDSLGLATELKD